MKSRPGWVGTPRQILGWRSVRGLASLGVRHLRRGPSRLHGPGASCLKKGWSATPLRPTGFVNPANTRWVCSELVEEICHKNGEFLHDALWVSGNTLAPPGCSRPGARHLRAATHPDGLRGGCLLAWRGMCAHLHSLPGISCSGGRMPLCS